MTGLYRVARRLNLRGPRITVVSIGMEHLSVVTFLLMYLNRFTKRNEYFGCCKIQFDSTCHVLHGEQDFCNFCLHSM